MPLLPNIIGWLLLRTVAGFASAVVFVIAVNLMLDHLHHTYPVGAGTFLVAAIKQNSSGWLGSGAWLVVGLAAVPSAALWAWLCARWSHPTLLAGALLLQAFGIALPALAPGAVAASSEQSCSGPPSSGSARWPWQPDACSDSPAPWRC